MSRRACLPLSAAVADRVLHAVIQGETYATAAVLFPAPLADTARAVVEGLARRGIPAGATLTEEEAFARLPLDEAAGRWVPPADAALPELLVLFGAQPWSTPFDEDWRVELAAMQNREQLRAAGTRLLFLEWPRGARKDAELDLRPGAMAEIFTRSLDIDYAEMRRWNRELGGQLEAARQIQVRCPRGTDLSLSVAGRRFIPEDCRLGAVEPAVYLPGGEIYAPAQEDSASGSVAFFSRGELRMARFDRGLLVAVERCRARRPRARRGDGGRRGAAL